MKRLVAAALAFCSLHSFAADALRVCADPDNLPFSRADGSGFENRIAQLIADDMKRPLEYAWLPDRRGFVRKTLGAQQCDVIIGVPAGFERTATTQPYYRSTYVFVERADAPPVHSFDDPRLASMRIGVQLIGNDLAASPPGAVLARLGDIDNVRGYPIVGDTPSAQRAIDALERGEIDGAFLWGPQAGYFARHSAVPLRVAALPAPAGAHFEFAIAMGVRRGDAQLRERLADFIRRRQPDIDRVLAAYGVPLVEKAQP
ncbi:MAG TPA: substrate-binding domain-containing protein [Ramlibacter sp.]